MPLRVLVSRTDRLGDVALTLPLCGLLKARCDAHVTFLGRPYVRDLLAASDAVDDVILWDDDVSPSEIRERLRSARADVVVHVRPNVAVARAAWAARIRVRIGTSRRAAHWLFCNRLESVARRRSALHEAQLNVHLARSLLGDDVLRLTPSELAPYGTIAPRVALPGGLESLVARDRFTLVLHPYSGGSATEWPLASYSALARALAPERFRVLVTGSAAEGAAIREWLGTLPPHVHDVTGQTDVASLIALLAAAGGMVAASTGPLHLGAAAGTRALGLFSPRPPIHPGRWAPIGRRAEVLVAEPARSANGDLLGTPRDDAALIPVSAVLARVEAWARDAGNL